jgi:hypothetical protein
LRPQRGWRAFCHHPALIENHDPFGEAICPLQVLGGQQHCGAIGHETLDDTPHGEPASRVKLLPDILVEDGGVMLSEDGVGLLAV